MLQVVFNEISAAEISALDTLLQLELLSQFKVSPEDLDKMDGDRFGKLERPGPGKTLHRYRAKDYRIYFEVVGNGILVRRVLHKNTLQDFLLRNKLPVSEDEALSHSKTFWKLIEEGEKAKRV